MSGMHRSLGESEGGAVESDGGVEAHGLPWG